MLESGVLRFPNKGNAPSHAEAELLALTAVLACEHRCIPFSS